MSAPVLTALDARGVATVTFNRPEVNNAYNGALLDGVHKAMDDLAGKSGVRVLVLKGNGRHFQAGADLTWVKGVRASPQAANIEASRITALAIDRLNRLPVPVIALIQGGCFGGGTGIAAACDIVIAADNARFSIAEVRWGITASIIIPQLNDAMSVRQVRRYALTGEHFGAAEAVRIGLAHMMVPLAELEAAGAKMVEQVLQNGPDAIAETKACALAHAFGDLTGSVMDDLVRGHARKRQSEEAAEGLASFAEKRAARWSRG